MPCIDLFRSFRFAAHNYLIDRLILILYYQARHKKIHVERLKHNMEINFTEKKENTLFLRSESIQC